MDTYERLWNGWRSAYVSSIAPPSDSSVFTALLASGRRFTRWTARAGEPRGYFCGMGVCQDCLVTVDGLPNVRACMTPVRDRLRVETQRGLGDWSMAQ